MPAKLVHVASDDRTGVFALCLLHHTREAAEKPINRVLEIVRQPVVIRAPGPYADVDDNVSRGLARA